jgi:hypothetical protein
VFFLSSDVLCVLQFNYFPKHVIVA